MAVQDAPPWINSFANEAGEIIRPPIAAEFPLEIYNRLTFTAVAGDRTRITLRGRPIRATAEEHAFFAGMHASTQGVFGGTFSQLEAWLAR